MRVLMLVKGLDLGGTERVVTDLTLHLRGPECELEVALLNHRRSTLVPTISAAGVVVHTLPGTDRVGWRGLVAVRRLLRTGNWDVVHAHGPVPIVLARLFARCRVAGTIHNEWHSLRRPSRWALALAGRRMPLVAVSEATRRTLPEGLRRTAQVIAHGVDLAAIDLAAAAPRRAPTAGVQLITVASHRRQKNYSNLLRAVAAARVGGADVHLRAIGEGPRLAAHRQLAAALGVAQHVSFEAPRIDVLRDIAGADVFVLASDYEGQPIVIVEALACGRPVIATRVGRAPELVTADVGVVVEPNDPVALATAIASVATDPATRVSMGAAATARRGEFSLDHAVAAHLALYRRMTK